MANPEHLEILKQGVEVWNKWRLENPEINPDLTISNLSGRYLRKVNFFGTDFTEANLSGIQLVGADIGLCYFKDADLTDAKIISSVALGAKFYSAKLIRADLTFSDFTSADLCRANLTEGILSRTILRDVDLEQTDFTLCFMFGATFSGSDLSSIKGLDTVRHIGPSSISIDTIYRSQGHIPEVFLRGCGVPDEFINYMHSLTVAGQPIQFYSCFISYSTKDEEFARRLYSRMRDEHLLVWFATEDMKGGQKLHVQIERAIQLHDRLLIILSENSMQSEWVMTEIRRARKIEIEENRRKLFPIAIVDFEKIKAWKCFDSDSGKDLAVELREYFIPDFSTWKDHDSFEKAFDRLLRDLKAEEKKS